MRAKGGKSVNASRKTERKRWKRMQGGEVQGHRANRQEKSRAFQKSWMVPTATAEALKWRANVQRERVEDVSCAPTLEEERPLQEMPQRLLLHQLQATASCFVPASTLPH